MVYLIYGMLHFLEELEFRNYTAHGTARKASGPMK